MDITIRGAKMMDRDAPWPDKRQVRSLGTALVDVTDAEISIERVAPTEWPPRPGDVWRDRVGRPWFVIRQYVTGAYDRWQIRYLPSSDDGATAMHSADRFLRDCGPLTLVHRELEGGEDA